MKPFFGRAGISLLGFVFSAALAQAHPGHDDGHELTWDFGHLAEHPLATLAWTTLLGAAIYLVVRLARARNARSSGS
jgi:hypothetical protein